MESAPNNDRNVPEEEDPDNSTAIITGVAVILCAIVVAIILCCIYWRLKRPKTREQQPVPAVEMPAISRLTLNRIIEKEEASRRPRSLRDKKSWPEVTFLLDDAEDPNPDAKLESGPWQGVFRETGAVLKIEAFYELFFENGTVDGHGEDSAGTFSVQGTYTSNRQTFEWEERYDDRPDVTTHLKGANVVEDEKVRIHGNWSTSVGTNGAFRLKQVEFELAMGLDTDGVSDFLSLSVDRSLGGVQQKADARLAAKRERTGKWSSLAQVSVRPQGSAISSRGSQESWWNRTGESLSSRHKRKISLALDSGDRGRIGLSSKPSSPGPHSPSYRAHGSLADEAGFRGSWGTGAPSPPSRKAGLTIEFPIIEEVTPKGLTSDVMGSGCEAGCSGEGEGVEEGAKDTGPRKVGRSAAGEGEEGAKKTVEEKGRGKSGARKVGRSAEKGEAVEAAGRTVDVQAGRSASKKGVESAKDTGKTADGRAGRSASGEGEAAKDTGADRARGKVVVGCDIGHTVTTEVAMAPWAGSELPESGPSAGGDRDCVLDIPADCGNITVIDGSSMGGSGLPRRGHGRSDRRVTTETGIV